MPAQPLPLCTLHSLSLQDAGLIPEALTVLRTAVQLPLTDTCIGCNMMLSIYNSQHVAVPECSSLHAAILVAGYRGMPCGQALRALAAACREQMEELTARVIANVAYGFASAAFWDGPLMDAFGDRVAALAHTCTTQVGRRVLLFAFGEYSFLL